MRCARNFSSRQFSFRTPIHLEACVGCNYRLWIEIWCETAWKTSIGKKRLRAQMSMTQKDIDGLIRKTTSRATRKTKRCDGIRGTTKNALESPFRRSTVSTFPSDTAHPTDDWVSIDPRKRLASSINDSSKSDENKKERERERERRTTQRSVDTKIQDLGSSHKVLTSVESTTFSLLFDSCCGCKFKIKGKKQLVMHVIKTWF